VGCHSDAHEFGDDIAMKAIKYAPPSGALSCETLGFW